MVLIRSADSRALWCTVGGVVDVGTPGYDIGTGGVAGSALVLPRAADSGAGVLIAVRHSGAQPFQADELDTMTAFAGQGALALRLTGTQHRIRELTVLAGDRRTHRPR